MTMVSSYFAKVGVSVDPRSLRGVQAYLRSAERYVINFSKRVQKTQRLNIQARIDGLQLIKSMQKSMRDVSKTVVIPLTKFDVRSKAMKKALNTSLKGVQPSITINNIKISKKSLSDMRRQVRESFEGYVIRPRIQARMVNSPTASRGWGNQGYRSDGGKYLDPRNTHRMSPWHNPMMIGGGVGAFMRYGMYSLPMVGGVLGLNALSNFAHTQSSQRTALRMVTEKGTLGRTSDDHYTFLETLSERTGRKVTDLAPLYTQLLAGSQGTGMESQVEDTFGSIIEYASVMGLNDESVKLAMRGVVQMIGKQQIMAEEFFIRFP